MKKQERELFQNEMNQFNTNFLTEMNKHTSVFQDVTKKYEPITSDLLVMFNVPEASVATRKCAKLLECNKREVCLLLTRISCLYEVNQSILCLRYYYNEEIRTILKSMCKIRFSDYYKGYLINLAEFDADNKNMLDNLIAKFSSKFKYMLYLDTNQQLHVFQNLDIVKLQSQTPEFSTLPFFTKISKFNVIHAITTNRPEDKLITEKIYVFDGDKFVLINKLSAIYTKYPYMLFRYNVQGGKERYIWYDVIGNTIYDIAFGNKSKECKQFIAIFRDTYELTKGKAFIDNLPE